MSSSDSLVTNTSIEEKIEFCTYDLFKNNYDSWFQGNLI